MKTKFKKYKLDTLISEISKRNSENQIKRVYSVTNSEGFVQSKDYFDKEVFSQDISNYKIVKKYQFAYNPSRINVGSIAYLQEENDVVVSPLYFVFSCTDVLVPEYLLRFIKSPIGLINVKNKTRGSVRESLNYSGLSGIEIPLPSVNEQLKIATVLRKVESLIRERRKSIDLLDELLKSTFLRMFGDPVRNEKKFVRGTIRDVVTEVKYGTSKSAGLKGRYAYLRMNNITPKGYMDFSDLKYIDIDDSEKHKYIVKKGDLLFNRTNSKELVGKTGVFFRDDEMVIAGYLIRVRTNAKANSWYLWGYLNSSHGKKTLFGMSKAIVGMANINAQELQDIEILIPPIKLQNQFAAIVEKTEVLKAQFQGSLSDLEELYASLSQRAFKGELDLSAVEIDETLLPDEQKVEPVITIPPSMQKAIELSDKINKQFEGINRITKIPSALTKQLEQWNKLQDQFKSIPKLPQALLQAQENMERIQKAIGINKTGTTKNIVEEETSFNWAVLANCIKERYKDRHFNFEMLHSFIQKDKLTEATPYYASEELKTNPRLNDAEDLKSFIQTAIQNIEMDEKQQRQINPFLRLNQSFYNAEEENFILSLHKEDFKLIKDKTARQRSGIYFSLASEA